MRAALAAVAAVALALAATAAAEAYPSPINPFVEGTAPLESTPCTRRNGCLGEQTRLNRPDAVPIAMRVGKGGTLGVRREQGYPPDGVNGPVSRWLSEIPPPPAFNGPEGGAVPRPPPPPAQETAPATLNGHDAAGVDPLPLNTL